MNRVTIELWLWLGNELKGDFESPSEMRSIKVEEVEDGATLRRLLCDLAKRYPAIAANVFETKTGELRPFVVMNYNDRVISPYEVYDRILRDGDKITILPLAGGG
jgi:molybdopterin converting factor small subunit